MLNERPFLAASLAALSVWHGSEAAAWRGTGRISAVGKFADTVERPLLAQSRPAA